MRATRTTDTLIMCILEMFTLKSRTKQKLSVEIILHSCVAQKCSI